MRMPSCPGRTAAAKARSRASSTRYGAAVQNRDPPNGARWILDLRSSVARGTASGTLAMARSQPELLLDLGNFLVFDAEIGRDHLGIVADVLGRALGDLDAVIHHHDAVGDFHHHRHVVDRKS